jgi:4-amino-4-deoxy-L-arabinose transferase-like glycosyltransferase
MAGPMPVERRSKWVRRWWLVLGLASLWLPRWFVHAWAGDSFREDPDAYLALAEGWHHSGTFGRQAEDGAVRPTAYRPPLYPWLLSRLLAVPVDIRLSLTVFHLGLGLATICLVWSIGNRLATAVNCSNNSCSNIHSSVAWLAAAGVAIDPILVRQSTLVMTETVATFLAVAVWWLWLVHGRAPAASAWRWLGVGVLLGLHVLTRASSILWLPSLILLDFVGNFGAQPQSWRKLWRRGLWMTIGWLVVVAPWAMRNEQALGRYVWTTTHGGYTLLLANNPILYEHFQREGMGRSWDDAAFHRWWEAKSSADADEWTKDRMAQALAWQTIVAEPWTFAKGCLARFGWFWAWWPAAGQASPGQAWWIGLWYLLVSLLFVGGGWNALAEFRSRRNDRWKSWLPGVTLLVTLTLIHLVYWSNMRMRAPLMPMVYLLAAFQLERFAKRWSSI